MMCPAGSLNQAIARGPSSPLKMPRSSVFRPGMSYCSMVTPRATSSSTVVSMSSTGKLSTVCFGAV